MCSRDRDRDLHKLFTGFINISTKKCFRGVPMIALKWWVYYFR
jgi:hypothetical protein